MSKIPHILVITKEFSPTFYIRHYEPLMHLCQQSILTVSFKQETQVPCKDLDSCDIAIFNRVQNPINKLFYQYLLLKGKRIIYDVDDYIVNVPSYSHEITNKKFVRNIHYFIRNADVFIVSTVRLKNAFQKIRKDALVVSNSTDFKKYGAFNKNLRDLTKKEEFNILITFSDNIPLFEKSKKDFINALNTIFKKYLNITLMIIAPIVLEINDKKRIRHIQSMNYPEYKLFLKNNHIHLSLNPIEYSYKNKAVNTFLQCKSEIKFIDYAAAKIIGIYSNSPIYKTSVRNNQTGFTVDNSYRDWVEKIEYVLNNYLKMQKIIDNAFLYAKEKYDIQTCTKEIMKVITFLIKEDQVKKNPVFIWNYFVLYPRIEIYKQAMLLKKFIKQVIKTSFIFFPE